MRQWRKGNKSTDIDRAAIVFFYGKNRCPPLLSLGYLSLPPRGIWIVATRRATVARHVAGVKTQSVCCLFSVAGIAGCVAAVATRLAGIAACLAGILCTCGRHCVTCSSGCVMCCNRSNTGQEMAQTNSGR
ncbi:hypothetical protein ACTHGU_18495 [Chitinophagaceae bacterium MMS25-I14]